MASFEKSAVDSSSSPRNSYAFLPGVNDVELGSLNSCASSARISLPPSVHSEEDREDLISPKASPSDTQHNRTRLSLISLFDTWKWELFTWAVGTSGLLVILALLGYFNHKPTSKWKSDVQITTTVAVISQFSQSSLLVPISYCIGQLKWKWFQQEHSKPSIDLSRFDLASRGPYGSVRLLQYLSWKPQLVSLGALATILLMVFPAFIQQSVRVDLKRVVHSTHDVYVPRAFDVPKIIMVGGGKAEIINTYVQTSVNTAFHENSMSPSDAPGFCPTSQCSWDPYTTLGICTSTEDITHMLVDGYEEPHGNDSWWMPPAISVPFKFRLPSPDHSVGLYAFAPFLNSGDPRLENSVPDFATPNNTDSNLPDVAQAFLIYHDPCLQPPIKDTELGVPTWEPHEFYEKKGWRAFKARFRVCLQTLQSTFNSSMTTTILQSQSDVRWRLKGVDEFDANVTELDQMSRDFAVSMLSLSAIGSKISATFNVSGDFEREGWDWAFHTDEAPTLAGDVLGLNATVCESQSGPGFESFTKRMENIAIGITNAFRTSDTTAFRDSRPMGPSTVSKVNGTAWTTEQYVLVNFWWLLVPLMLYLMITIFLFATILQTRQLPLWKSSPLALLQCKDPHNSLESSDIIEKDARRSALRLEGNGSGWCLVETSSNPTANRGRLRRK